MPLRILFFGRGPVGVELLHFLAGNSAVEIVEVAWRPSTQPGWWGPVDVPDVAKELGLPLYNADEGCLNLDVDILFSVHYDRIIAKPILDLPKQGAINLHGAILPKYRGRFTFLHAILNGENEYGSTLHYMDEHADTGDIIAIRRFPIDDRITARELFDATALEGIQLFKETLPSIIDGSVQGIPQGPGEYLYRTGDIPDGEVDLAWDSDYIDRFVRAMYFPPFEPAFIKIGGKKFLLHPSSQKS